MTYAIFIGETAKMKTYYVKYYFSSLNNNAVRGFDGTFLTFDDTHVIPNQYSFFS